MLATNEAFTIGPESLRNYLDVMGKEKGMNFRQVTNNGKNLNSDHISFSYFGIPSLCVERNGGSAEYAHTPRDSVDYLDGFHLQQIYNFVFEFLLRIDRAKVFPFDRTVKEEHRKQIADFFIKVLGIESEKAIAG